MEKIESKGRARLINYITSHKTTTKYYILQLAYMTLRELEQEAKAVKLLTAGGRLLLPYFPKNPLILSAKYFNSLECALPYTFSPVPS